MNILRRDYIKAHCERNGWELITYTDTHVVFKRSYSPCGDGLYYGTIEYHREWSGLCHGHYDMTLDEALTDCTERTIRRLGVNGLAELVNNAQGSAA